MDIRKHDSAPDDNNSAFNNNYMCNNNVATNSIAEFYNNKKIFITGGTGFLGKALIEKLLRTCTGFDSIYLLMRPKRGVVVEQRLKDLLQKPLFNRIRDNDPDAFDKVKVICGDVSMPNLGLSDADRQLLIENVNIVIHSAATVKFDEKLDVAVNLNTLGTKRILDLCMEMKHLQSFVHISTAFSNSDKDQVEEVVYKPAYDPYDVINCVEILPPEGIELLAKEILGKHPNTYTLTKSMAEYIVLEKSKLVPSAIVRPSIITGAWKEPYSGWVDSVSGITGIFMECGRGTIKSILCDEKFKMDIIPVDTVVNTILTSAWHTVQFQSTEMRVYNCTSGSTNPITWKRFKELTLKYSKLYPSKYVTWYPGFTYRTSAFMHFICVFLFHIIPSAILDVFLYFTKQKPIMLKISKKFVNALNAGKFFSTNEWDFKIDTMLDLMQAVKSAKDGKKFDIDIRKENNFNWNDYVKDFQLGVRQYILKDDLYSLKKAKVKLNRLFWFQKVCQFVSVYFLVKFAASNLGAIAFH